jgi:YHS domain-containing protein
MAVPTATARYHALHDGIDYVFCTPGCKAAFEADPGRFVPG